jgi:hypothetical protein
MTIPMVQKVQVVQPLRSVQTPTIFPPRRGGDVRGGLIGLNVLNDLNDDRSLRSDIREHNGYRFNLG